ncbi:MAG: IPT/TIG domain-containing protein, partial [Thermoanaerobaculia bacterium]|nr:IPT/TIG domain-containing protein [Thermoanaerobaculia bacterium]
MRRTLPPLLATTAGLCLLLSACSGESPTSPKPPTDPGGTGACTVTIALDATSVTPMAGTAVILRATVRKGGATVPDGTSVSFTTDFGFFLETGLPSVSKVTQNGFADVTLGATSSGLSKVKATFECGSAEKSVEYQPVPPNGPFISSIDPGAGTCAGGDTVTINGGRFGSNADDLRVLFGGRPASVQTVSDTKLVVLTPSRTLANPQVPEVVDVVLQFYAGDLPIGNVTAARAFTYYCVDPNKRLTISAVSPNSGSPDGGQQVQITGNNFLPSVTSSAATTRVTFGGAP